MSPIAKESKATNWVKVEDAQLKRVFAIFFHDIDPDLVKLTKQQMAAMIERQAGKRTPDEIITQYADRQQKRTQALSPEFLALSYPDGIQDVLNRCGTRVVVSEKYPDTTEGRLKAITDLKARLHRLGWTLEQAKSQPIKEKLVRTPSQRWDVVEFALDDTTVVPTFVAPIISKLTELDPSIKFGKRKGAKAGVVVRLPELVGKFNILINLPPEYVIPAEETGKTAEANG